MEDQFSTAPLGSQQRSADLLKAGQKLLQSTSTRAGINPVDASRVGTTQPLDIPTNKNNSKTDKAMASIQTSAPAGETQTKSSFGDIVSQSLANIKDPEQKAMVQQLLDAVDNTTGGKFSQAGEDVLSKLLDTQFSQKKRKSEEARLQEQAGLPELFAEQGLIESNYNTSEAARNSRLLNETGGKTTISKTALSNRQSEIQRQYGLQVADNRINELVVAGKINSANILISKSLDLKYGDLEAEIDLYKSQLDAITPFMNNEQSKLAEQRQFLLNQAQSEIQSARDTEKSFKLNQAQALKNAYDRGADVKQIAQIQDAQSIADLASTGFMTTQMEKLQMQTERLQQANIQGLISERANAALSSRQKQYEEEIKKAEDEERIAEAKSEKALAIKESIDKLAKHPGLRSAVGPNPLYRSDFGLSFITGAKSDFISEVGRLSKTLTLENMDLLKGPATDKDVEIVAESMSKLDNRKISESSYLEEMQRLQDAAQRIVNNVGLSDEQAQFYYGVPQEDIFEVNQIYGVPSATSTFNPSNFY